jgi:hypothetical protein
LSMMCNIISTRARMMDQDANIVATKGPNPDICIYNISEHDPDADSCNSSGAGCTHELLLTGHTKEGYAWLASPSPLAGMDSLATRGEPAGCGLVLKRWCLADQLPEITVGRGACTYHCSNRAVRCFHRSGKRRVTLRKAPSVSFTVF